MIRRSLGILLVLLCAPSVAADPGWTDITTEVVGVLGDASRGTTYYLKNNSIRSVKSVNLTGVTYRQAVFSFLERGSTYRLTYSFNCPEYSFKLGSHAPGYWHDLQWILPEHDKNSFSWFAFKYLCGARPDPWVLVTEDVDGARFFLNKKAAYKLSFPRHGPVYTFVAVIIEPKETAAPSEQSDQSLKWPDWSSFQLLNGARGDARMRRVYIACKTRSIGMYSLEDAAGDQGIQLVEANPGSVASGILREVC